MPSSATAECSGSTAVAHEQCSCGSWQSAGVFCAAWVGWDRRTSVIPVHTLLWHWWFCLFYCFVFLWLFFFLLSSWQRLHFSLVSSHCACSAGNCRARIGLFATKKTGSSLLLHIFCEENPDPVPSTLNQAFSSPESSRKQTEPSFHIPRSSCGGEGCLVSLCTHPPKFIGTRGSVLITHSALHGATKLTLPTKTK